MINLCKIQENYKFCLSNHEFFVPNSGFQVNYIIPFQKSCSIATISKIVTNLDYTLKKTLRASEQNQEDVQKSREDWREFQEQSAGSHLVFLDESGAKTNLVRLYGRAKRGKQCYGKASAGRWERLTMLSAVSLDGSTESIVFDGATDRDIFR